MEKEAQVGDFWESPSLGKMFYIPAGRFWMGSPETEEGRWADEDQHEVELSRGFYLMECPVTQGQWESVMGRNPSFFKGKVDSARRPVEQVSWDDVQEFIQRLNARDGVVYRLPTEAEWEYAARGGESYRYAGSDILDEVAWYGGNSQGHTWPVGQKKANGYGLRDMSGNVYEWVQDCYGPYTTLGKSFKAGAECLRNPQGQDSGAYRVNRGGSWRIYPIDTRVASRNDDSPSYRYDALGFRLARSIP
jgi:formylglycine-generating enzyme required for sulfatase activity